jgi:transcription elongation factor
MSIDEISQAAKARGLVRSLRHFSQDFSGRTPNYAFDTGLARCSAGALLNLYRPPGRTSAVGPKGAGVQTVARSGGAQRRHPGGAALNGLEGGRAAAAGANAGLRKLLNGLKANQAARIWPEIADPTIAQREAMPYEFATNMTDPGG